MPNNSNAGRNEKPVQKSRAVRRVFAVLKWVIYPLLCVVGLYIGLRIGYSNIGGGDPSDVLRIETWKHMLDLVFAPA